MAYIVMASEARRSSCLDGPECGHLPCADMFMDICIDMCVDMFIGKCIGMCIGMCIDMSIHIVKCIHMCKDICTSDQGCVTARVLSCL